LSELVPGRLLVCPDLRGHGDAGREPPWDTARRAEDVLETVESEVETGVPDWLGFSFGARVLAALLTQSDPEEDERACLLDPALTLPPGVCRERASKEGRPRSGRGERPTGRLSSAAELRARRALVGDLERAITRDAQARVRAGSLDGPVLATEGEINPPSQRRVERDRNARGSDYDCFAVTSRDPDGRFSVGYTFDATVDYRRFRFRWAKACRPPGEGAARLTC
jgi:pimeloyl-ACP methyl ester carboxylesterase